MPSNLSSGTGTDDAPESSGHQLSAEADTKNRDLGTMRGVQELDLISEKGMVVAIGCAHVTAEHHHSVKPARLQTIEVSRGREDLPDQQLSMLKKGEEPAQVVLLLMDNDQKHCGHVRHRLHHGEGDSMAESNTD
jgi:hypothetical protein